VVFSFAAEEWPTPANGTHRDHLVLIDQVVEITLI
jgi:hypothetical protein